MDRARWLQSGIREIEVGSFVSPKLLPQMADCEQVVRQAVKIEGLTVLALAPNTKGAERGIAAGVHKLSFPVSASRAHSLSNIRMTPEQAIEQVRLAVASSAPRARRFAAHSGSWNLHRVRLLAGRSGLRGLGDADGRRSRRRGSRVCRPFRHRRLRQPRSGEAHVHAPAAGNRNPRRGGALPQHARSGPRQRRGGARSWRHHVRRLAGRPRRLPVRARRHRQHRHRRSGVPSRIDGPAHRYRSRPPHCRPRHHPRRTPRRSALRQRARRRAAERLRLRRRANR